MHRSTASSSMSLAGLLPAVLIAGACSAHPHSSPRPERDLTVQMVPHDLVTNMPSDVPIVITLTNHQPWETLEDFVREELPSWHESVRTVRWPSREPVEGQWIFSNSYPLTLVFEPSAPLPRGWYAIQANFETIVVPRGTASEEAIRRGSTAWAWDGGWTTSRFHVGSFPIAQLFGRIDPPTDGFDGSGGTFSLFTTEPVLLERDQSLEDMLAVSLDGERIDCPVSHPDSVLRADGFPFQGLQWTCSDVPHPGRVEVTLRPFEGAPAALRYGGRGGTPVWHGETATWFSSHDVDESIFTEEVRP